MDGLNHPVLSCAKFVILKYMPKKNFHQIHLGGLQLFFFQIMNIYKFLTANSKHQVLELTKPVSVVERLAKPEDSLAERIYSNEYSVVTN